MANNLNMNPYSQPSMQHSFNNNNNNNSVLNQQQAIQNHINHSSSMPPPQLLNSMQQSQQFFMSPSPQLQHQSHMNAPIRPPSQPFFTNSMNINQPFFNASTNLVGNRVYNGQLSDSNDFNHQNHFMPNQMNGNTGNMFNNPNGKIHQQYQQQFNGNPPFLQNNQQQNAFLPIQMQHQHQMISGFSEQPPLMPFQNLNNQPHHMPINHNINNNNGIYQVWTLKKFKKSYLPESLDNFS